MSDNVKLVIVNADGSTQGEHPHRLTADELSAAGFQKQPMLDVIRAKCLDCSDGQPGEVRNCVATGCPLWLYRMGKNPFGIKRGTGKQFAARNSGEFGGGGSVRKRVCGGPHVCAESGVIFLRDLEAMLRESERAHEADRIQDEQ